jgi:hypothetical protein
MPTGTQQVLEGLICLVCDEVVEHAAEIVEQVCSECETECFASCDGCGVNGFSSDMLNHSTYTRVTNANVVPIIQFYYPDDSCDTRCDYCVFSCENCGTIYADDENSLECCDSNYNNGVVHNYSYRPMYYFFRTDEQGSLVQRTLADDGVLYMGIELEVAKMNSLALEFNNRLSPDEQSFLYMKEDGSIGPDGVELVTMPATIQAFSEMFPFEALDWARSFGARSFAYSSCGFHIHVSRSAFTATHMWKFIKFQLNNPALCQRVAQRDESSYASWYYEDDERRSLPDYVKGKKSNGRRYLAINFQNHATVELRYFKGNILEAAILKNLEFVQSLYDYTKELSVRDVMLGGLTEESYNDWFFEYNNGVNYPNLLHFFDNNQNKEEE